VTSCVAARDGKLGFGFGPQPAFGLTGPVQDMYQKRREWSLLGTDRVLPRGLYFMLFLYKITLGAGLAQSV